MYIIRNAHLSDLDDLYSLSKKADLLNLPSDIEKLRYLISKSDNSFKSPNENLEENYYIFCLVNKKTSKVIGVSMIHGKHGTEDQPHYYLKVGKEVKESSSLNKKIVNGTLKLGIEPNGFTEIGGLILDPSFRGSGEKLGKQLSMCRFLYIIQNSKHFTKEIHSELLPPFDENGKSLLWEGLGRKFLNMDYWEADILSQKDKSFIHDLFPSSTIYLNLLPQSSIDVIGEVGKNTQPVKKMLEDIGFEYTEEVDPFDGGPHYRAKLTDLRPYKEFCTIKKDTLSKTLNEKNFFISDETEKNNNPAVHFIAKAINANNINEASNKELFKGFYI